MRHLSTSLMNQLSDVLHDFMCLLGRVMTVDVFGIVLLADIWEVDCPRIHKDGEAVRCCHLGLPPPGTDHCPNSVLDRCRWY